MRTAIVIGSGQMGTAISELLDPNQIKLLGFGDNDTNKWTDPADNDAANLPIMPVEKAIALDPDMVVIGVLDEERSEAICSQIIDLGFNKEIVYLKDLYNLFDIRSGTIRLVAERIIEQQVPGAIAELGVYKGDTAWQLNTLFPDRTLYLFDTFEGFDSADTEIENNRQYSMAKEKDFSDTDVDSILKRIPYPNNVIVKKGYFPETTTGLDDEKYAFVSLDADLYAPTLAGLEYFYPRISPGGIIVLHDYGNSRFKGVKEAVDAYETDHGKLLLVPVIDLHRSCIVLHP